ncbi:MAG: tryptophan synthase subunit alpha [Rudanella sp.]|nr:tryptophan synthase subunit alpha [Rudanella sp.]
MESQLVDKQAVQANRITDAFTQKSGSLLNVYFTAGFPNLGDTVSVLEGLEQAGADFVEIGMPYSDPVADGETIQKSNMQALENGMSLTVLFEQLADIRSRVSVPILLMGYINPVLQFGVERFCQKCQEVGVDGVILPDLPLDLYLDEHEPIFRHYGILNIFLITPQTTDDRIRLIDEHSEGFIYMVSSASITGSTSGVSDEMLAYFDRINAMNLRNARLIGFGIKDSETFQMANKYASGAIIGSAFIRLLQENGADVGKITAFVEGVRG